MLYVKRKKKKKKVIFEKSFTDELSINHLMQFSRFSKYQTLKFCKKTFSSFMK